MTKRKQTERKRGQALPPIAKLTEAQFTVLLARAGRTKSEVKHALFEHLVNGECLYALSRRYEVDRSNLYDKLKRMGLR